MGALTTSEKRIPLINLSLSVESPVPEKYLPRIQQVENELQRVTSHLNNILQQVSNTIASQIMGTERFTTKAQNYLQDIYSILVEFARIMQKIENRMSSGDMSLDPVKFLAATKDEIQSLKEQKWESALVYIGGLDASSRDDISNIILELDIFVEAILDKMILSLPRHDISSD